MAVRKIPHNARSLTGIVPDGAGKAIGFESSLERDFVLMTRFLHPTARLDEQPVRIEFQDQAGDARSYVPDFLVTYEDSPADLVEVKPAEDLARNRAQYRAKFAAARAYANARGWQFRVVTEIDIRGPEIKAYRFLLPYRNRQPDPGVIARILRASRSTGPTSAKSLLAPLFTSDDELGQGLTALWHLVAAGVLTADLSRMPSTEALISPMPERRKG
jgi:hypothetical protein